MHKKIPDSYSKREGGNPGNSSLGFRARSHTGVMDYDEACLMHPTPGVVHNFPKAVGV